MNNILTPSAQTKPPKGNNRVPFSDFVGMVHRPELQFTVSSRGIRQDLNLEVYLKIFYIYLKTRQVSTVFGNTSFSSLLYGGRSFDKSYALTEDHLNTMRDLKIHLALTLTNHFFDEKVYQHSWKFLEHHHRPGNVINIVADKLAQRIRKDFPDYTLNASIIKNLNTGDKIRSALDLYDRVVLPMDKNDDDVLLEKLPDKDRLILFGNGRCAYNCPARTCYIGFSQEIQGRPVTSDCSKDKLPRPDLGMVYFNLDKLNHMGFTHFKLIPDLSEQSHLQTMARNLQAWKVQKDTG